MIISQRRQREKEKRRGDIIDAAEPLFFAKGFDNVTMDEIAKKVELNKATIYLYFESKESLYYAIVVRSLRHLVEIVDEGMRESNNGIDDIWGIWEAHIRFAREWPDHFNAYMFFHSGRFDLRNIVEDSAGHTIMPALDRSVIINVSNGPLLKEILDLHGRIFDAMTNAIERAIHEKSIRMNIIPSELAATLLILVENGVRMNPIILNEMGRSGVGKDRFLRDIRPYLEKGLGK
jgi:AcrR family transcriptional regulator